MVGREFILALCEDSNSANQNPNGAVHLRFAAAFSENSRVAPRLPTKLKHSAFWIDGTILVWTFKLSHRFED